MTVPTQHTDPIETPRASANAATIGFRTSIRKKLSNPYLVTATSTIVAAGANAVVFKAIAVLGTATVFYEYSTSRRLLSSILPVLILGFGVGLPLRISRNNDRTEAARLLGIQFLLATLLILLASIGVALASPAFVARYLNDLPKLSIYSLLLAALSLNYTGILYAYHRGFQEFNLGNRVILFSNGLFPILAAFATHYSNAAAFFSWSAMNFALTAFAIRRLAWPKWGHISKIRRFMITSIGRIPGDLAYAALFLLPVSRAHSYDDVFGRSVFNYFFVMLGLVTASATPLSIVLLPVVGSLVGDNRGGAIKKIFYRTALAASFIGFLLFLFLHFYSGITTQILMSQSYRSKSWILQDLAPSVVGLALFVFLKSVVDGLRESPITAYISVMAVAAFLLLSSIFSGNLSGLIRAVNTSFLLLGSFTLCAGLLLTHWRRVSA